MGVIDHHFDVWGTFERITNVMKIYITEKEKDKGVEHEDH